MFRRTSIPNLQFNVTSSTQVESFTPAPESSSLVVTLPHQEQENPDNNKAFAKSPEGDIVEVAFTSPVAKTNGSIQIVYNIW